MKGDNGQEMHGCNYYYESSLDGDECYRLRRELDELAAAFAVSNNKVVELRRELAAANARADKAERERDEERVLHKKTARKKMKFPVDNASCTRYIDTQNDGNGSHRETGDGT